MITSFIVKFFLGGLILGALGLIPVILMNRKTSRIDTSFEKKSFNASNKLKKFKTNDSEIEIEADSKTTLESFKVKE